VSVRRQPVRVRLTEERDFDEITALCRLVYPEAPPWKAEQLASHRLHFPEGQFVAVEPGTGQIIGMAASLVILWSDYTVSGSWRDFTDHGMFSNHDPQGRTLYGAEVLVRPALQRRGVGAALYRARRTLCERLGLLRIRAAARLRGYHRQAARMTAEEYVMRVVRGLIGDATLSFQLRHGFHVMAVVPNYIKSDPESLGYAAVIEWINGAAERRDEPVVLDPRFDPLTPLPS